MIDPLKFLGEMRYVGSVHVNYGRLMFCAEIRVLMGFSL